jgi:hypothetical protein
VKGRLERLLGDIDRRFSAYQHCLRHSGWRFNCMKGPMPIFVFIKDILLMDINADSTIDVL